MCGQALGKGPSGMVWGMGPLARRRSGTGLVSRLSRVQELVGDPVDRILVDVNTPHL